jgi:hypothetical protein
MDRNTKEIKGKQREIDIKVMDRYTKNKMKAEIKRLISNG